MLVGLGIAEIGQYPVTHVPGEEASRFCDDIGAAVLVRTDEFAHVLGVESDRKRRGADEVAEHDGQLSALRSRSRLTSWTSARCYGRSWRDRSSWNPGPALGTEAVLQGDVRPTCRTGTRQGSATLAAKVAAAPYLNAASRT